MASLLSTAHTTLLLTFYLLLIGISLILSLVLPFATFHLGRLLVGYHFDVGHPGSLIAMFGGIVVYSALCGWGLPEEGVGYLLVNVPFGVGVVCVVGLGAYVVGFGVVKGTEIVATKSGGKGESREENIVKGKERVE